MKKTFFFIDGFNFYHSINGKPGLNRFKWLDYKKLATILSRRDEQIQKVLFFTALAEWDPGKVQRHKDFIDALSSAGVETILGKFKQKEIRCRLCRGTFYQPIEKQTDVNISISLLSFGFQDAFDKAYVVSGDTDLVPALKAFKKMLPNKEVCIVFPIGRKGDELKSVADFHIKIKPEHLRSCLLSNLIALPDGRRIICPPSWSK